MEQVMLDMIPTGAKAVCHVSQYDIGRTIRFNLRSGGTVYTLSGTETIKVYIKKPDGTTAERNIANTSSTYVDWVTGEGDCDQAGNCECELVITSGTTVIGSKNFTVKIEEDPYNDQGVVTETAGPAVIATFTTNVVDLLQEVKCSINPIQNGTPWIDSNEVNKVPYIKRAVAGTASRIGNHLYDKLVGGTVAWNQLVPTEKVTVTFTASEDIPSGRWGPKITRMGTTTVGHKVLGVDNFTDGRCRVAFGSNTNLICNGEGPLDPTDVKIGVWEATATKIGNGDIYFRLYAGLPAGTYTNTIQFFDLTAMFGSTIADYIYSLEQATAGAGVAWFRTLFPNDYYAYNAGEFMSVKATAHVMKNASNQVIGNYALDSNLELRGLFKLDANNKLYADGDTYESSGAVERRYGIVDLGSLTYVLNPQGFFNASLAGLKFITDTGKLPNLISLPYITDTPANVYSGTTDKTISTATGGSNIWIRDAAYSDPAAFKAAMSGVFLVYELATPTTETADPFTNPQVCDENGTEEYTDSRAVAIPVGHETYQANICPITGFDELNIKQSGQDMSEIAKLIRLEFDDTVYLAEVSCLNGVWKLKLLGAEVDLGNLTPVKYTVTEGNLFRYGLEDIKAVATDYDVTQALCSHYPSVASSSRANNTISQVATLHRLDIIDNRYSDAMAFKNAMSGVKLVYPLETPTEITLDETEQFEALLGVNNVWHDGNGNTEVKYLYNA